MTFEALALVVSLPLSVIALVVSIIAHRNARLNEARSTMGSLMAEYQSPETLLALESLREFRKQHSYVPELMRDTYRETLAADRRNLWAMDPAKRLEYLRSTVHCHRRIVSHFLQRLQWLVRWGGVTAREVFEYWSPDDVESLVEEVLLPLGMDPPEPLRDLVRRARKAQRHLPIWAAVGLAAGGVAIAVGATLLAVL